MHYNVWPDLDLRPRSGGYDCIYKGVPVNIKEAPLNGWLLDKSYVRPKTGLAYVLCAGADFRYKIVGWCWSHDLISVENLRYWDVIERDWLKVATNQPSKSYPPTYALPPHSLRKMSDFGS